MAFDKFNSHWLPSLSSGKASLSTSLLMTFGDSLLLAFLMLFIRSACLFVIPLLLKDILQYLSDIRVPVWYGYVYLAAIFSSSICATLFQQHASLIISINASQIKSVISTLIYTKALKLGRAGPDAGTLVNLMTSDVQTLLDSVHWVLLGILAPFQLIAIIALLYLSIAQYSLIPVAIFLLTVPAGLVAANLIGRLRYRIQTKTDARIELISDVISAIEMIKYHVWERPFIAAIRKARKQELEQIRTFLRGRAAILILLFNMAPVSLGITILVYATQKEIILTTTFTAIAYLNLLRNPFSYFPTACAYLGQYLASMQRIQSLMMLPEVEPVVYRPNSKYAISIVSGTFSSPEIGETNQEDEEEDDDSDLESSESQTSEYLTIGPKSVNQKVLLIDINMNIEPGTLTMIVGSTGSGKSNLAIAILGEMTLVRGELIISSPIAYAAQKSWLLNSSVRENILFGLPYEEEWYLEVVKKCCLVEDFANLPAGDNTEVAEHGVNLSVGQRNRISIAKALYSRRNIYIFDDPFSSLDNQVARAIFENVIAPLRDQGKTVLIITNILEFLSQCDHVGVLRKGRLLEQGTFDELMERKGRLYKMISSSDIQHYDSNNRLLARKVAKNIQKPTKEWIKQRAKLGRLTLKESPIISGVGLKTYKSYYCTNSKSLFYFIIIILLNIARIGARVGASIWLSRWLDSNTSNRSSRGWMPWYGGLIAVEVITCIAFTLMVVLFSVTASKSVHQKLLRMIMRTSMACFAATPTCRIIGSFSKDMHIIDDDLPNRTELFLDAFFELIGVFANLASGAPYAIVIVIINMLIYIVFMFFFSKSSTDIQRIESSSRAPILSHLAESCDGALHIRAYQEQEAFITEFRGLVDMNNLHNLALKRLSCWFSLMNEFIAAVSVSAVVLGLLLLRNYWPTFLSIGLAANVLGNAVSMLGLISLVNSSFGELESRLNSVEKIFVNKSLTPEAEFLIPETKPKGDWPPRGAIEFDQVNIEYIPGVPVLSDFTCKIKPGKKIGIVGKTGAGKSSLINALFRITELPSGRILIDGVDIATLGLYDLRHSLSIIPQSPHIFKGTVRFNLDPFGYFADHELWRVLRRVKLETHVQKMPDCLDTMVDQDSFSGGQHQLFSMARCLLQKCRILLLDEATSSLDNQADALVQILIRKYFRKQTVLTVAHRLKTIIDSDKIIVIDQGRMVEFGSPKKLLKNEQGIFYAMWQDCSKD